MKVKRLLTLSGWGLNHLVFSKLNWEYSPLSSESWLHFSPHEKETVLRHSLDKSPTPVLFMALSLGAFLSHDTVIKCLDHPKLQGAVFFSIAKSFVQAPEDFSPQATDTPNHNPYNSFGSPLAPLRAMAQQLSPPKNASDSQISEHLDQAVLPLLRNFIAAGISETERPNLSEEETNNLILTPSKARTENLLTGIDTLTHVTVPSSPTQPTQPTKPTKPVIVIQGDSDVILDHKGVEAFAKEMNYPYKVISEGGHFTPYTQPHKVKDIIRAL